jgi:GTP-binding protein Era
MKAGFVSIVGKPNAGKSTLLNALLGEKLAIVSPKAQTTRHRIKGILGTDEYQIVFSDTPGIIEPKYKLHEKMMGSVGQALEDADLALLLADVREDPAALDSLFQSLKLSIPSMVVINKIDSVSAERLQEVRSFYSAQPYGKETIAISALRKQGIEELLARIIQLLPEGEPFFGPEELTDLPTRFFVAELIREQIFHLYQEEIPYHATVLVKEFREKTTLVKIVADIIVHRESQKGIILGEGGKMIRQLGTAARQEIEKFLGQKVFLELFVKVRPKWRDSDLMLKEYGYI